MNDLIPGVDGALEFGVAVHFKKHSLMGRFITKAKLKISYWRKRLYSFPFYNKKPVLLIQANMNYMAWYLIVPGNKIVRLSKEQQVKIDYLESGKR
jgi:hypothetical protein